MTFLNSGQIYIRKNTSITDLHINEKFIFSDSNITASIDKPYSLSFRLDSLFAYTKNKLNISWKNDHIEINKSIRLVEAPIVDFQEFDKTKNYFLTWHQENSPDLYLVKIQIRDTTYSNVLIEFVASTWNREKFYNSENLL